MSFNEKVIKTINHKSLVKILLDGLILAPSNVLTNDIPIVTMLKNINYRKDTKCLKK